MQEDDTTTTEQAVGTGAQALPVEQTEQVADSSDSQVSESTNEGADETALPEQDDKLANFAKGQGIEDVTELTERERKLLKMAHDNNAEFQRNRQKATELEKTMSTMSDESAEQVAQATGRDPELLKEVQGLKTKQAINDFWGDNPDARAHQAEIAETVTSMGLYGTPEALLSAAWNKVRADGSRSQGKREALQSLAHKQQAAVPRGNATTPVATPKEKPAAEMSIKEMEAKYGFVKR